MNFAVSIITPTFNRANLLPRVWSSLQRQTLSRFQWIVVDDGSLDNTREIVKAFDDPRITYVYQSNAGVNAARNRGDLEVRAEFVVYLDSDDEFYDEESLEMMVSSISMTSKTISHVSFSVVDSEGESRFSFTDSKKMEVDYLDTVCEQRFWGEFFSIWRTDAIRIAPWPPYQGLEAIRHWRIARERLAIVVQKPARIYHFDSEDNLVNASSLIGRAASMTDATSQLIADHQSTWLLHCPSQLGKYYFYKSLYQTLSESGSGVVYSLMMAFRHGSLQVRIKALALSISLLLPLSVRRKLFNWWARKSA